MAYGNITPEERQAILSKGEIGGLKESFGANKPPAHENIDSLINKNDLEQLEIKLTKKFIQKFPNLFGESVSGSQSQDISDWETHVNQNQNKDYFELMDNLQPLRNINSLMPWQTYPKAGAQMTQGFQEHGGLGQTMPAALRGILEQFTGEYDPVGPQGVPFQQFMQQKKQLDPKVKSIVGNHVNQLFKK